MRLLAPLRRAAQRTLIGGAATCCAAVGLGFLTFAAWITLVAVEGTVFAALVLGAGYLGLAALMMAVAAGPSGSEPARGAAYRREAQSEGAPANVVDAFLAGMAAGQSARRHH